MIMVRMVAPVMDYDKWIAKAQQLFVTFELLVLMMLGEFFQSLQRLTFSFILECFYVFVNLAKNHKGRS